MTTYPILDVSNWPIDEAESVGGEEKEWVRDPEGHLWLFKARTEHPDWVQGEDWAEKITAELAAQLGIPAATVELARRDARLGTVSRSLRPPDWELHHGSILLSGIVLGYVPKTKDRRGHTLENIARVLEGFGAPVSTGLPEQMTAFEAFAGYLVLDALVGNQDRHEENWAVLRPLPGLARPVLAGSYDHGSSLGFNLRDDRRKRELDRGGVPKWACRARAQRFDRAADGRLDLVSLAKRGLERCSPTARDHWIQAITASDASSWPGIVDGIPEMSDLARRFVRLLLETNRGRLLDEL